MGSDFRTVLVENHGFTPSPGAKSLPMVALDAYRSGKGVELQKSTPKLRPKGVSIVNNRVFSSL